MQNVLRAVLLSVVALGAACGSRADLEAGRFYQCDFEAGAGADQCPGGWTCTRGGFCQDPAIGAAVGCQSSSECTGGWVCLQDGTCHDPTVGAEVSCDSSADCTGGWHCGVAGVCYERETVTDVRCRQSEPNDCAPGWRCGLEGRCHDTTVADAYRCDDGSDSWCEQGWRCGSSGVCVDARLEALRAATATPVGERLSPTHSLAADEIAGSGTFESPASSWDKTVYVLREPGKVWVGADDVDLGRKSVSVPVTATHVAAAGDYAYFTTAEGLFRIDTNVDTPEPEAISLGTLGAVSGLRSLGDVRLPLAVISGASIGFVAHGETAVSNVFTFAGATRVFDVTDVSYRYWSREVAEDYAYGMVAATDVGLFAAYQSVAGEEVELPSEWLAVSLPSLPNTQCGTAPTVHPTRLRGIYYWSNDIWRVAVEVRDPSGANPRVMSVARDFQSHPTADCPSDDLVELFPPTDACPGGEMTDFDVNTDGTVTARCRLSATSEMTVNVYLDSEDELVVSSFSADWWDQPLNLPVRGTNASTIRTVQDATGRLGTCDLSADYYSCSWLTMNRPPVGVTSLSDGGYAVVSPTYDSLYDPDTDRSTWYPYGDLYEQGAFGLEPTYYALGYEVFYGTGQPLNVPCSFPRGLPDMAAYCVNGRDVALYALEDVTYSYSVFERPAPRAVLTASASSQASAAHRFGYPAEVADLPDGGQMLLMSVGDALWGGPPKAVTDAGVPANLTVRLVPQSRGEISALAVMAPAAGGPLVESYVIAQERVYRVYARSEQQWFADPIILPEGSPISVWADGRWGRVGFSDGRVYSLPSAVLVGPVLEVPGGVLDYGELCGHGYALAADGLYQLTASADGNPVGTWRRVDLAAAGVPASAQVFGSWHELFAPNWFDYPKPDRLVHGGDELLIFTEGGAMVRYRDPACSAP